MTKVVFKTTDPQSPNWRAAWDRYLSSRLEPVTDDFVLGILKEVHHRGWRAGVLAIRQRRAMPSCPRHYIQVERKAWEHGVVAGKQAAKEYLTRSGKKPEQLL